MRLDTQNSVIPAKAGTHLLHCREMGSRFRGNDGKKVGLVLALALASCGNPPPRADVPGQDARTAMDKAAADYAACVDTAANSIDLAQFKSGDLQAGPAATQIIESCADARTALIAKVYDVRRIGHPKEDPAVSQSVAEQSVDVVNGDLRERAVTAIVSRQVGAAATPASTEKSN